MRNIIKTGCWLVLLLLTLDAHARPVRLPPPDELAGMAEVIVIGEVTDVRETEERTELKLGSNPALPMRTMEATVKRLGASKGEVGETFTVRCPTLDWDRYGGRGIVSGPVQIFLQKGGRYRMYLKKKGDAYVGVLDGEFDDGPAVEELAVGQGYDAAPVLKEEAVKLARAYFKRLRPGDAIASTTESYCAGEWLITVYGKPSLRYPVWSSEAEITVDGARSLKGKTWVGKESPLAGGMMGKEDIGLPVRIVVEGRPEMASDGKFETGVYILASNSYIALRGVVREITATKVAGTFRWSGMSEDEKPVAIEFPRDKVDSLHRIFSQEP